MTRWGGFLTRTEQDGEAVVQQIREAIAINDEEINRHLISYVFWRAIPFDVRLPFAKSRTTRKSRHVMTSSDGRRG
jgi:hypothetical protein